MKIRMPILTGMTLATALALAGCSSANSTAGGSASRTPGAQATVSRAPEISSKQLTGTQLTAALLTGSDVPAAGFFATSGGATDSGGSLTRAKAKFNPGTMSCADLQNKLGEAGFGETATSTNALVSERKETVTESVYQFADAAAANAFYSSVKANWASCRTFADDSQGSAGKFTVKVTAAKAGVGQQDFANTETCTLNGTPCAIGSTLALDGPDVLLVTAAMLGTATVPTDVDSGSLAAKLIAKIAAAG